MSEPIGCCRSATGTAPAPRCVRCDLLVGLDDVYVLDARLRGEHLEVTVESEPGPVGCPDCGAAGVGHGRQVVRLVDIPAFGRPVTIIWRKRRFVCPGGACERVTFVENLPGLASPRHATTARVVEWAVGQLRREHATVSGLARQLGTAWHTVWTPVKAALEALADDPARFDGVRTLGVDEHIWHHVSRRKRGPKELTGMVDLTRDGDGKVQARLLDLVPGRSGVVFADWLTARGKGFTSGVEIAALDPFHGYKRAIDDELEDATAVLDAFHVVKLALGAVDEVAAGGCSSRSAATADVKATRSTGSAPSSAATPTGSPSASGGGSTRPWPPTPDTRNCSSPGKSPTNSDRPTTTKTCQPGAALRRRYSRLAILPDPGNRPTRTNAPQVEGRLPRVLDHRPLQQRRNRSDQWPHRTPPAPGPRLPQPRQLSPADAPHRRRATDLTPRSDAKSRV